MGDSKRQDDDLMFYSTLYNCCDDDEMIIGMMGIKNKFQQFFYMRGGEKSLRGSSVDKPSGKSTIVYIDT